jgi:hypothetical protein
VGVRLSVLDAFRRHHRRGHPRRRRILRARMSGTDICGRVTIVDAGSSKPYQPSGTIAIGRTGEAVAPFILRGRHTKRNS